MQQVHSFYVRPRLPEKLQILQELAYNLYWFRGTETEEIFARLDPALWVESGYNPVLMLMNIQEERLEAAANDAEYLDLLNTVTQEYHSYQNISIKELTKDKAVIAFFSAEFGIREDLQIYAGGLGILAGDYLKSASDLGLPVVGVGLLYQEGYFRQILDSNGRQQEYYKQYDFNNLPLERVCGPDGNPLNLSLDFPDRKLVIQVWRGTVGRIQLILLDSNHPNNLPEDRKITDRLYGGDFEKRIQQEYVLGIGGYRALKELNINPVICHLNEGHSGFLGLERIRHLMNEYNLDFEPARYLAASGNIFTTHTPVKAGIDLFPPYLMDKYFTGYYQSLNLSRHEFLSLGRIDPNNQQEFFNMAVMALKLSFWSNGVSKLHGQVARNMWCGLWPNLTMDELPITSVTNGVHINTWIGPEMAAIYDRYLGTEWRYNPQNEEMWRRVEAMADEELWEAHQSQKQTLINFIRERLKKQLLLKNVSKAEINLVEKCLDPNVLTIGFARRFAPYKRPTLLLRDRERLLKILNDSERPLQLVFAGKAHPHDELGKNLIQEIYTFVKANRLEHKVIFLEDYDIHIARHLIQGVDLWLGNPLRPLEASSTSGMKAVANGALHISTLDGWWDEAWKPELGWAIGNGENSNDSSYIEAAEAESLYLLLEEEIIPLYYQHHSEKIPKEWVAKMKASIMAFAPVYNTHRMVLEYNEKLYRPAAELYSRLQENGQAKAKAMAAWEQNVKNNWDKVKIVAVDSDCEKDSLKVGGQFSVRVTIELPDFAPADIKVEISYGLVDGANQLVDPQRIILNKFKEVGDNQVVYSGEIKCCYSGKQGFNVKVYPYHPDLATSYQVGLLLLG